MTRLAGKRIVLGVGGGIAAYKAPTLVRALREQGALVRVVLTEGGASFVSQLALQVVSENRVGRSLLDPASEYEIGHIETARWADVVLVAPATANLIARIRAGMADDLLTTVVLATMAPLVLAPSMNTQMLRASATQENLEVLRSRGAMVVIPDVGELACKEVGAGRLPDPLVLIAEVERALTPQRLAGVKVTVSAGPTREHFDPVRFLSNPSSGKMGYAIAAAAFAEGADVILISGPSSLDIPPGVRRRSVTTAAEMCAAVQAAGGDVLIMAAAVADWTPGERDSEKRKKRDGDWQPTLVRTTDILREVSGSGHRPRVVIGFAAETQDVLGNAREKLASKNLDAIVANDVSVGGFGTDGNAVTLITATEEKPFGPAPKRVIGDHIIDWVANRLEKR
ncbi:MAG: phosphopantothenoylcysteine decarboxylase/phosphopantothenate--cysteine ligase [Bradymonadia bacterium]